MPPQRKRIGCLGQLLALVLLVGVGFIALMAVTNPWIFTVGGHYRALPFWEGVGELEGPGGTYRIFVFFQPESGGFRQLASTLVWGTGWMGVVSGRGSQ